VGNIRTARILCGLALTGWLSAQAGAQTYTLVTEPDQGLAAVYSLIRAAKSSLDLTMYELADTQAEQLLAQAVSSGVTVRVILDQNLRRAPTPPHTTTSTRTGFKRTGPIRRIRRRIKRPSRWMVPPQRF
jgi:phosphatidylserine/phosphatidylglycerophosphate/cardiolipin synthase-like enzyme